MIKEGTIVYATVSGVGYSYAKEYEVSSVAAADGMCIVDDRGELDFYSFNPESTRYYGKYFSLTPPQEQKKKTAGVELTPKERFDAAITVMAGMAAGNYKGYNVNDGYCGGMAADALRNVDELIEQLSKKP